MLQVIPIALLLAAAAAAIWNASGRRGLPILAVAWLLYAVYEWLMVQRVLCSGECNIRVDLLLLYPVLLGSSLWSLVAYLLRVIRRRRGSGS